MNNIINFNLIDDSEELTLQLVDDNEEINFSMTDYDDTEIKNEINGIQAQVDTNTANISDLNDRVDNIPIVTKTSQLTNDSGFITEDYHDSTKQDKLISGQNIKTINNQSVLGSGNIQIEGVTNYEELNNLPKVNNVTLKGNKTASDLGLQPAGNYATSQELTNEATARENADTGLQNQIDAITASSDVKDIVGTYNELLNYPTSTLGNDDIIKVLQDSTHNNAMSYYRWVISGSSGSWQYIGQEGPYYTKSEADTLLNAKQNTIDSSHKLLSDLVDDTNQTNLFVTANEKTTWNNKADAGFTGIITGTSSNPTDGASLPVGVYKASDNQNISYINLIMKDGTTKRQSVQKGGIVIRTAARLEIFATQNLMYQYDTTNEYFYPAENFIESNLRREYDDGLAYLGKVSPPNNVFITTPITELEATINTGDTGHVRIWFSVGDNIAEGDFGLSLTATEGNELIYKDGATPKPVSGETWILEFYGNTCEPICFKATDGKSREDLLKQFMRKNSDQIYYPSLDGKPNVSIMAAKGYEQDRKVGLEAQNIEFTNFQNWTYYGIPNYVPLDLSLYNTSTQANMLHPYTELPDGDYWVKTPGKIWLGKESYELIGKEYIHKKGTTLTIWGGEYACAYYSWNATDGVYEGGFFITYQDLLDYISEQGFEKGYTITRQTTATGSIVINNGRHYKRVRETGVTSLTFSLTNNLGEVPDAFKARVTLRTATTFTAFNVTQRDAYKLYFMGDDCANGVITGVANKYYDIEFKADGFGNIVGIVHSYELPTT